MNVLVLLGGYSAERDVSWASGMAVAQALSTRGHATVGLDPATGDWHDRADWFLADRTIARVPPEEVNQSQAAQRTASSLALPRVREFDTVFIALHGGSGEDGTVQTLLTLAGIPYTGSGSLASGIAMNKDTSKRLFLQSGIATPAWIFPRENGVDIPAQLGLPLIVKPVAEGSTVGVSLVKHHEELEAAAALAGARAMFERYIPGRELSVGVLDGEPLPPVEIKPQHEIYDYECKYTDGKSEFICPAPLEAELVGRLGQSSVRAFIALGCSGYARVDFRLATDGTPYCLEVNTLPGMTSHSLVPLAAAAHGIDFAALCERICTLSVEGRDSGPQ